MKKEDDLIIVGQNDLIFKIECKCGERYNHIIDCINSTCPKCSKKNKMKVKEMNDYKYQTVKIPAWLILLKFETIDSVRIHVNDLQLYKAKYLIKLFENMGCKSHYNGMVSDKRIKTDTLIQVHEFKLSKSLFQPKAN